MMRTYVAEGLEVLEVDADTARVLSSLLCQARPQGEARGGKLLVVVRGDAAPPGEKHVPVEHK